MPWARQLAPARTSSCPDRPPEGPAETGGGIPSGSDPDDQGPEAGYPLVRGFDCRPAMVYRLAGTGFLHIPTEVDDDGQNRTSANGSLRSNDGQHRSSG